MATKFKENQVLKREIRVYGVDAPVIAEFSAEGIRMYVKGTKISMQASWVQVTGSLQTPSNVPSFLAGAPYEFLKYQSKKKAKRQQKPS